MAIRLPKINSLLGAGTLASGATFATESLIGPMVKGVKDQMRGAEKVRTTGAGLLRDQFEAQADEIKRERLARLVESNQRRLAQWDPELYNQVLAGRRLPRGAVMIGGVPRTDLLAQMAMRMAMGSDVEG